MVAGARVADVAAKDIACRGKTFHRHTRHVVRIIPAKRYVAILVEFVILRCCAKVDANFACGLLSLRTVGRRPVAFSSRSACLVHIVKIAEYR